LFFVLHKFKQVPHEDLHYGKLTLPWENPPFEDAFFLLDKGGFPASYVTGWWFQRFLIFTPIWGRFPF